MSDDEAAAVDEAAEYLYAVVPRDFVAARDARVKELRAAGDADAAGAVAALRRPTVVAWLANQLVRRHGDQVGPLLDLGAALREATAALSGSQLRELSRQRHQVIASLVGQARRLAAAEGQPVTEDAARGLEQTLTAALADEAAGELLRSGRLTDALVPGGFGDPPTSAGTRRPAKAAKAAKRSGRAADDPEAAERAARRSALEAELAEAWAAARAAADARTDAEETARSAESAARESARTAERLRGELAEAESAAATAEQTRSAAAGAREDAREVADRATRKVSELQRALDDA